MAKDGERAPKFAPHQRSDRLLLGDARSADLVLIRSGRKLGPDRDLARCNYSAVISNCCWSASEAGRSPTCRRLHPISSEARAVSERMPIASSRDDHGTGPRATGIRHPPALSRHRASHPYDESCGNAATPASQLEDRHGRLRAARRRVPGGVVAERHQHRRPEVLPGHPRHARAGVVAAPGRRPRRRHDHRLGHRGRLLRRRRRGRGLPRRAQVPPRHPAGGVQQPGVVQHRRRRRARSRRQRASSSSVDDTMDSILNWYREEGTIFKGGSGSGSTSRGSARRRSR